MFWRRDAVFFQFDRRGSNVFSMHDEVCLVLDVPIDGFPFLEIHGFGNSGGEVDEPLIGSVLPPDLLHFGWVSHGSPPVLVYILD